MLNKKRLLMWYEVQKLTASGLNKSQIREETGLDRATIRKYQKISEEAFHHWAKLIKAFSLIRKEISHKHLNYTLIRFNLD